MLFHTLYAPESAEYFRQLSLTLDGEIDAARFQAALAERGGPALGAAHCIRLG